VYRYYHNDFLVCVLLEGVVVMGTIVGILAGIGIWSIIRLVIDSKTELDFKKQVLTKEVEKILDRRMKEMKKEGKK